MTHFDFDPRVRGELGVRVAVVTGLGESVWGIDLTGDRPQNPPPFEFFLEEKGENKGPILMRNSQNYLT